MADAIVGGLSTSFLDADRRQRVLHSKIGCVLSLVLMPAGVILDLFVYPEHAGELLASRLLCDVAVLPILGLLFTSFGARHIRVLGIAWALLPAASISWMIFYTQGVASPYYAGLNLVIIAVSLLMPWTLAEVLATCGITLGFYVAACLGHTAVNGQPVAALFQGEMLDFLVSNTYFISLTAIICATASFFQSKLRFQDYRLRHELAGRNNELAESYQKLADLDRLKSQFFANVSHELRTPLTLIISPLDDLLQRGGTGVVATDAMIAIARDNGLRLLRLINELLDLVKLDEKGAEIHPRNEDLATLAPGIISSAAHLARAKGQELRQTLPSSPVICTVDATALEKILLNLFTNAVKFTPAGGTIECSLGTEGGEAVIRVRDTGIGIAAENLPRIFDRFAQLDQSSTRKYSGIGIGLALARELAEAHAGTLTAESELDVGTTMTLRLPLAPGVAEVEPADRSADAISAVHSKARRAMSLPAAQETQGVVGEGRQLVLVVEDEPDMRQFVTNLLVRQFRVARAADGLEGYRIAAELKPELAILDLMLPGMDGLDLCGKIRRTPGLESMKIVLLTARTDEHSKLTALQRGANDFLTKPFSSLELQTRVANLLRAADLEDEVRRTNIELRQTLDTLRATEAQLIQSEKINALGTLAAGLLHEIFNPLNFTLAAVQMAIMETQETQVELRDTLADIENGMKRIRDIVADLRTFAHPERHLTAHPVKVLEAVNSARRIAGQEIGDCEVQIEVPADLVVMGSEGQVVQMLVNFLSNGARATRDKSAGLVKIVAERQENTVYIRVRDNGVGIEKEKIGQVFDPFFTTREPGQGMGLGLTICQTIARNHGGNIRIESQLGEWTEVTLELPSMIEAS